MSLYQAQLVDRFPTMGHLKKVGIPKRQYDAPTITNQPGYFFIPHWLDTTSQLWWLSSTCIKRHTSDLMVNPSLATWQIGLKQHRSTRNEGFEGANCDLMGYLTQGSTCYP